MKKLLFFLLLMTAVVGRAQTSLDLLPAGTSVHVHISEQDWAAVQ